MTEEVRKKFEEAWANRNPSVTGSLTRTKTACQWAFEAAYQLGVEAMREAAAVEVMQHPNAEKAAAAIRNLKG